MNIFYLPGTPRGCLSETLSSDISSPLSHIIHGPLPNIFEANETHSKIFNNIDNEFEKSWIDFHRTNAILRVLCKKCNLSRKKSRRLKCSKV